MTTNEDRYGLHISRETRHYPGDILPVQYLHARLVRQAPKEIHPKGLVGHALDGFQLTGHVSESEETGPHIIGFVPEYHNVFSVKLRDAQNQLRLLRRCERNLTKDFGRFGYNRTGRSSRIVASVAEALGLDFICENRTGPSAEYANGDWTFYSIADGLLRVAAMEAGAITAYNIDRR